MKRKNLLNNILCVSRKKKNNQDPLQALISHFLSEKDFYQKRLNTDGAILFRDYEIDDGEKLSRFVKEVSNQDPHNYIDGNSPRTKISSGVYTSTEYPPEYQISQHSELSYCYSWPTKIFFCCMSPSEDGGETPLARNDHILSSMPPEIVSNFEKHHVKYIRNLHSGKGLGKSWQQTFETENKKVVEDFCEENRISWKWKDDGGLTVIQLRPATIFHPVTKAKVWFNQADQFHPFTLPEEEYLTLSSLFEGNEEELPQFACYGNSMPIEINHLKVIKDITENHLQVFEWKKGDLLLVDNILMSHGRMPYSGSRKILVSMSDFINQSEIK